ncbi:acyl-CoA dehydrogenase family member 11 [Nephila pilipes]|uniref:Acyl-CoA dehydrogenase family member 11 n=1 Tax=Nephila pilipes TaxID=299642 RepID=A0A8X6QL70_NEPPI|nr:acyl-CoA dehydrogenase family member 11 [Nephila pilipes]
MLNITRLHNAMASVGSMRRILQLSRDYSRKRVAFGKTLAEIPLHMRVLSTIEMEIRGSLLLLLKVGILLGKTEKLYTAKQAVAVASEGLETFGRQGYMEDSRLPVILRNAQVLPIWEGTTNVMSLDVIRSLKTNSETLMSLKKSITLCMEAGKKEGALQESGSKVDKSINYILRFIKNYPELLNIAARDISYSIARSYIGALLIENAAITKKKTDIFTAKQWCEIQELCPLSLHKDYPYYVKNDFETIMEGCKVD